MPVTDAKCRAPNTTGKRLKLSDGGGLRLVVSPTGKRQWELAYRHAGKPTTISLGAYPMVSLAAARLQREKARVELDAGRDPAAALHGERPRARHGVAATPPAPGKPTFAAAADAWLDARAARWKPETREMHETRLQRNVLPTLGAKPVNEIQPADVLAVVRRLEAQGTYETARRAAQVIAAVMRFAKAEGHVVANPADGLHEAFAARPRVKHRAMIAPKGLPFFLSCLQRYDGEELTRLAVEFLTRTAARTGEVRFASWPEIEREVWRIPATRMKMGREHLVPLAAGSLRILDRMREVTGGSGLIFPGEGGKPKSSNTLLYSFYRLGYHGRATPHGLRRTFSTALNESGLFGSDWIEMQLAHAEESQVRGAYNAAEYWNQRVEMMRYWGEEVDKASDLAELI